MLKKMLYSLLVFLLAALSTAAHAQVYTGHDTIPRLRGVNASYDLSSGDYPALTSSGVNVVRYELIYPAVDPNHSGVSVTDEWAKTDSDVSSTDLASYQAWLSGEVTNSNSDLNSCIRYCAGHNIKVLIDLHTPPGGSAMDGPTRIFLYSDCLQDFLSDWALIAQNYASNSAVWGYDLCNEPDNVPTNDPNDYPKGAVLNNNIPASSFIANWSSLKDPLAGLPSAALQAAQQVRQYDSAGGNNPQHALVAEIAGGDNSGDYGDFSNLKPLPSIAGVVYSFHTYGDPAYSDQDDAGYDYGNLVWPDPTPDDTFDFVNFWRQDITDLYTKVQNARAFQLANNCQIFVGEFGCYRWSPGAPEYVSELINSFESYGWDWTYIGLRGSGWNGFAPEVGSTGPEDQAVPQSGAPYLAKTDEKTVLTSWFANNASAVPNFDFLVNPVGIGSSAYTYNPSAPPWNFPSDAGIAGNGSDFNNPFSYPASQCAFLQSYTSGTVSATGLISQPYQWMPGTSYTVSVNAAYRATYAQQTVNVYVGGTISNGVLSGGTLVGSITPLTTSWDIYTTPPFAVGQGSLPVTQLLSFMGAPAPVDQTAFLDSVVVSKLPPSFLPLGSAWLTGTNINDGSGSSGGPAETALAASDGDTETYYSSALPTGGWTGIDLGNGKAATVTHIYFYPRSDNVVPGNGAYSMQGGVFQGTNDTTLKSWTTLATVNLNDGHYGQDWGATGWKWCQVPVTGAQSYHYFRYLGPPNSNCNVAEVRYYGNPGGYISDGTLASSPNPPQAAFDGSYQTSFESSLASGGWTGIDLGAGNTAVVNLISFYPDATPSKMVGGVFQGTNDTTLKSWTNLVPPIATTPVGSTSPQATPGWKWTTLVTTTNGAVPNTTPYRFLRYYNNNSGNSGVGEVQFYGDMPHPLTGTNINDAWGTTWGNPPQNAYDGSTSTCYDSNLGKYGWTGIDVGAANPVVVTCIRFYPDSGWGGGPTQMIGGVFQGSNDEVTWKNLTSQITTAPKLSAWTAVTVSGAAPYRYLRYYDNGTGSNYCDIAEVQFIGY